MNRLRDDFLPIPDWPNYPINRFGQVRGRCGLLSCDTKGRVCIRSKAAKRQDALHVGELMEMTGVLVNPDDAPAAPSDVPTELEEKLLSLSYERDTLERQVKVCIRNWPPLRKPSTGAAGSTPIGCFWCANTKVSILSPPSAVWLTADE